MIVGAGLLLSSCAYYVPYPATAAAPPGSVPQQAVVAPAAPVYAYPTPAYAYPYPYPYPYYGYPWFGGVSVGARFHVH
jgi:hypothetical protein